MDNPKELPGKAYGWFTGKAGKWQAITILVLIALVFGFAWFG